MVKKQQKADLQVEYLPVDRLVPYAKNAKLHSDLQVEQIANSIRDFGFNDPVGVWTNKQGEPEIVEGHGRVLAAKKLGIDTVPAVWLDHLSDKQRRAYALAHNQTTLNSGFDTDILAEEFANLPEFDFGDFGFEVGDFSAINDLLTNDFVAFGDRFSASYFNVTLTFPRASAETLRNYLAKAGKEAAVNLILEEAKKWE